MMNKNKKLIGIMTIVLLGAVCAVSRWFVPYDNNENIKDKNNVGEEKESNVDKEDKPIIVVLDAGHGGVDPGKVGPNGALEKDINLKIVEKLKNILESEKDINVQVVLTRDDDSGHYSETDSNKKMADMKKRCEIINSSDAKLVVSIHQNSYHSPSVEGAQVFYYDDSPEGKKLAGCIQKNLVNNLTTDGKGRVEKENDNYYLLLNVSVPAVIVECGFLSNPKEEALLMDEEYQEKVALAIGYGIKEYLQQ